MDKQMQSECLQQLLATGSHLVHWTEEVIKGCRVQYTSNDELQTLFPIEKTALVHDHLEFLLTTSSSGINNSLIMILDMGSIWSVVIGKRKGKWEFQQIQQHSRSADLVNKLKPITQLTSLTLWQEASVAHVQQKTICFIGNCVIMITLHLQSNTAKYNISAFLVSKYICKKIKMADATKVRQISYWKWQITTLCSSFLTDKV